MTRSQATLDHPAGLPAGEVVSGLEVRVIGLGNTLRGDDGAGVRTVERLRASAALDGLPIAFFDGGTLNFTLLEHFEPSCPLIVIDAAEMSREPGTVQCFVGDAMDRFLRRDRAATVHEASIAELCDMARLSGRLPERRALVGIQPLALDWRTGLSDPVAKAVERAGQEISDLIGHWLS